MIKKQLDTAKTIGADTILVIPGVVNVEFSMPEKKVAVVDRLQTEMSLMNEKEMVGYEQNL